MTTLQHHHHRNQHKTPVMTSPTTFAAIAYRPTAQLAGFPQSSGGSSASLVVWSIASWQLVRSIADTAPPQPAAQDDESIAAAAGFQQQKGGALSQAFYVCTRISILIRIFVFFYFFL